VAKSQHLKLVSNTESEAIPPRRMPNVELRPRKYLTGAEIEQLMKAAGNNRYSHRDATMILVASRHELRPAELVMLRWDNVDLANGKLRANRTKNNSPSVRALSNVEIRALRRLQRESKGSPFVFTSERRAPFTSGDFRKLVARLGAAAKFRFVVRPHMLRHSYGFKLVHGVETCSLPPKDSQHGTLYAELCPDRFKDFWED